MKKIIYITLIIFRIDILSCSSQEVANILDFINERQIANFLMCVAKDLENRPATKTLVVTNPPSIIKVYDDVDWKYRNDETGNIFSMHGPMQVITKCYPSGITQKIAWNRRYVVKSAEQLPSDSPSIQRYSIWTLQEVKDPTKDPTNDDNMLYRYGQVQRGDIRPDHPFFKISALERINVMTKAFKQGASIDFS